MVEVTNNTRRHRMFRASGVSVVLAPGETKDVEMTEASGKKYEKFGRMHTEPGKEPALRPVLSVGKGKLAANPPKTVQTVQTMQVPAGKTSKKD